MARVVKSNVTVKEGFKIVNRYKDNTSSEVIIGVDERVEGLQFVEGEEVIDVTGRVSEVKKNVRKLPDVNGKVVSTVANAFDVKGIVVDSSEVEKATVRFVPAREILEYQADEGKEIKKVEVLPYMTVNLVVTLSDGSTSEMDIAEGDTFEGVELFGKDGDTETNIKVDKFVFTKTKTGDLVPAGIAQDSDGVKKMFLFSSVKGSGQEIRVINVTDPEQALEVLSNLADGDRVVIETDVEISETIRVEEGVSASIDLTGHQIIVPEAVNGRSLYAIDNYGDLTIEGGVIEARGIENFGTMTINDIDLTSRDANGGAAVWNEGTLTINGGIYKTIHEGSASDNSGPGCLNNSGTCTINGGTFQSVNKRTYSVISSGDITIPDGTNVTVAGAHGGIAIDAGFAVINGGTYTSTEYYGLYVSNDGIGTPEKAQVTVNGGTFTGKTTSVYIGSDSQRPVDSVIDINDGVFNNKITAQSNVVEGAGIKVYGGKFKEAIDAKYFAEGYTLSEEPNADGYYEVISA